MKGARANPTLPQPWADDNALHACGVAICVSASHASYDRDVLALFETRGDWSDASDSREALAMPDAPRNASKRAGERDRATHMKQAE